MIDPGGVRGPGAEPRLWTLSIQTIPVLERVPRGQHLQAGPGLQDGHPAPQREAPHLRDQSVRR